MELQKEPKMDIARRIELELLDRQKPMNEVIDRGDSPVQQFYKDATVFLTGGSGFLGKSLIEKLFRSCEIKKVYMLLRPKRGKTIQQRLNYVLKDKLYDTLRKKKPNFADCIIPVEGDISSLKIGLSDKDWNNVTQEVNVIIHLAATVNFNEPLRTAGIINVRGTREMLVIAKHCSNLKLFTHVSTAFAHATHSRIDTDVKEQFYKTPISPNAFLGMLESVDEERFNDITAGLIKDWPNTYTFTKAIAEELIRLNVGNLPLCIVKPPVVTSSFIEPTPGWIDQQTVMSSPIGLFLGIGMGVLHVIHVDKDNEVCFAPVDYVGNAIIASGWDSIENRHLWGGEIPIYTISGSRSDLTIGNFAKILKSDDFYRLATPKAVGPAVSFETENMFLYRLLNLFLHVIPGYFMDAVVSALGVRPKGMPSLVKLYSKIYKLMLVYKYFFFNHWEFKNDNLAAMFGRMSPVDKSIYNCDITTFPIKDYCQAAVVGLRRYIIKDGLKGSDFAFKKDKVLKCISVIIVGLYVYFILKSLYVVYSTFANLVSI